ncbi:MAG TPA: NAD(P)H-dependent oxidoreductase subunit E, partial [Aggregatilineales bacterium]|nr:NAD(P)H-dependent oxidoreductase subunit E [Aggregatilineales bacterium]
MILDGTLDLAPLAPVLEKYQGGDRADLLPALHDTQEIYGYLPTPALEAISQTLRVPLADIHGVVEFYTMFYGEPVGKRIIRVCTDPACTVAGAENTLQAACRHAGGIQPGETTADGAYTVERSACLGLCDHAPAVLVDDIAVGNVTADGTADLLTLKDSNIELRVTGAPRMLTRHIGTFKPTDLPRHLISGAFKGLEQALTRMTPDQIIGVIKDSKLVGRGGAAFPTGLKWQFTRAAKGSPKYVICNADESEPGTFKDRVLMEGDPFYILEGMAICGYAVGASKGIIFIRGEYPHARRVLQEAIDKCYKVSLLGENIMGTDFQFDVEIRVGAGAYICGEETAL